MKWRMTWKGFDQALAGFTVVFIVILLPFATLLGFNNHVRMSIVEDSEDKLSIRVYDTESMLEDWAADHEERILEHLKGHCACADCGPRKGLYIIEFAPESH